MSKKSRGFQPEKSSSEDGASSDSTSTEATTSRSEQRKKERSGSKSKSSRSSKSSGSIFEKYRSILLAGAAIVGVGVVGLALFSGASAAPYECGSLLTPVPDTQPSQSVGPLASEAPEVLLGFATEDLGRGHVATGSSINYRFCPPTSGEHWNSAGRSPLRRAVYGANDSISPGNWVHNLEHGYVVIAYQGDSPAADMDGIREVFASAQQSEVALSCGLPNKVIAVPFEDMSEPYAVLAWDRALMMPEWDTQQALTFANQWQDAPQAPEAAC
jgi:hypothetical protein